MPNELDENWKPIPGYEGVYSVSDFGRVRRESARIVNRGIGKACRVRGGVLKGTRDSSGHVRVSLSVGSKIKYASVHSLVMLAFIGERPAGMDICHSDGNPANNILSNLRYDTRAENINDSQMHGTFSEAQAHPCAILDDESALSIYNAIGVPSIVLAERYGVAPLVVNQIWRGETWKSVTGGDDVSAHRGVHTYHRTKLTREMADIAESARRSRTGRKDGNGIKPLSSRLGVDTDVIKALYAALDTGKPIIFAE